MEGNDDKQNDQSDPAHGGPHSPATGPRGELEAGGAGCDY